MIDFHTHLLHSVDDGSRSLEESLKLLEMLSSQGVKKVFATPHFFAYKDTPERFFERRERAYSELISAYKPELINVSLGAEVAYFQGVSRMSALGDMRLFGTKLLLLEMPAERWNDYTVRELKELSCSGDIRLVIAHVERCKDYQPRSVWSSLIEHGVLMQTNASYFLNPKTSRRAVNLLKKGRIHLLSSDRHNVTSRPPRLSMALEVVRKKLGDDFITSMYGFLSEITV